MIANSCKSKYFSLIGDSISTLGGYTEPDDAVFYEGARKIKANVFSPLDTWWGQVVDSLGGELLVNNSFSGSMVCKTKSCIIESYGCSDERTSALHRGENTPDVIMVYLGTNDWGGGLFPRPANRAEEKDISIFSVAYRLMLEKLRRNYPNAEIWCFTLAVSCWSEHEGFEFPYYYAGRHIDLYCDVIRECASDFSCTLVDLYRVSEPYDTIDGFHPNADGMKTLSRAVMRCIETGDSE